MRRLVAAVGQIDVIPFEPEENAATAAAAVKEAADQGADLVVLPELINTGYVAEPEPTFMRRFWEAADRPAGTFTEALIRVAADHGVHIVAGIAERHPTLLGVIRNVALTLTPSGVLHRHTKAHIPRFEKHYFEEGGALRPFETEIGRLGTLVCADNSFPEAARALALQGADVLAVSYAASAPVNPTLYESLAVTRAYENQIFVLTANRVGTQGTLAFRGGSVITAPDGTVLARLGDGPAVALAELNLGEMMDIRLAQTRFRDRRPHLYRVITQGGP